MMKQCIDVVLIIMMITLCTSYSVKNDRHAQNFAIDNATHQAYFCWVDADQKHVYFRQATLPPGAPEITYGDIEIVDNVDPYLISSCAVGVTSDGYVSVVYDINLGGTSDHLYMKSRLINGTDWPTEQRKISLISGDRYYPQLKVLTIDEAIYVFYVKQAIFRCTKIYVDASIEGISSSETSIYGNIIPQSLNVAYQDGMFLVKYSASADGNGGVYRLYLDTDLEELQPATEDFFIVVDFYDPNQNADEYFGPFPSPKEIDGNYLNLIGYIYETTTAPFINTKYNGDFSHLPGGDVAPEYYGSTTLFNMIDSQCTMTTDILEKNGTKYWVIALRNQDSHFTLMLYNLTTFVDSTNFTDVTFFGDDNGTNSALNMLIDEETQKMFFLFANVSGDVPILYETALCEIDNDCSCSHSCDDGYCKLAELSERCEDPLLPYCRYQDEMCYECLADSHCDESFCLLSEYECVECFNNSHCDSRSPKTKCDTSSNICEICIEDSDCNSPTSVCSANECVECTSNGHCGYGEVCDTTINICMECFNNTHCEDKGLVCDTTKNTCEICAENLDCPLLTPICSANECVECFNNSHCDSRSPNPTPICSVNECVDCLEDTDCASGVCSNSTLGCVECTSDVHCEGNFCNNNTCVQCFENSHCTNSLSKCDLEKYICADCLVDDDCPIGVCNLNKCVQCTSNVDCGDYICNEDFVCVECGGEKNCSSGVCFENNCVDCLTNEHCEDGTTCNDANRCTVSCQEDVDCQGNMWCFSQICVNCISKDNCTGSQVCTKTNECVDCVVNADCEPNFCVPDEHICVGCLNSENCDEGETCDLDYRVCVPGISTNDPNGTEEIGNISYSAVLLPYFYTLFFCLLK